MWLTSTQKKKKDFVTLKESHVVEIVLTAAARVKRSARAPISICLMLFLLSFKNDLHRESFPTRWLWQSTTFWIGGEVWTMIFTPFDLNHDESAGIVHCSVHMLFMFSCLLRSCPQHWAFGCPPQKNISLLSVRNTLWSFPRSVMMAQPHP